jgi:hypothetical protein
VPGFNGIDRLSCQPAAGRQRLLAQASRLSLAPHVILKRYCPLWSFHIFTSPWSVNYTNLYINFY